MFSWQAHLRNRLVSDKYVIFIAVLSSLLFVIIQHYLGFNFGLLFLLFALGLPVVVFCVINPLFAFLFVFCFSSFLFFIKRYLTGALPIGIAIELILGLSILGILVQETRRILSKSLRLSPIHLLIAIWSAYNLILILNPSGYLTGWFIGVRKELIMIEIAIVAHFAIRTFSDLKLYTRVWLIILVIASFYCFFQEIFGLTDREAQWLASDEDRSKLYFQYGRLRLWSIFSDPTTFGIFCSYGVVFSLVLATSDMGFKKRIFLIALAVMFFIASAYTGTRTAYAIIPIGFIFYFSLTIHNPRTIFLMLFVSFSLITIIFGPFYGNVARRIRSAFFPSDDASYHVREVNRERIRPYLYSHPFGGGMGTTGAVGNAQAPYHPLAGFPPDSYYLKLALENGYPSLLFLMILQIAVLIRGINFYIKTDDIRKKGFYLAYMSAFVALAVAGYAQEAMIQFPNNILFYSTFIIVEKLHELKDS